MKLEVEHLRRAIRYNPETGELLRAPHWKSMSLTAKSGRDAVVEIGGKRYAARRVIWAIMTGEWPDSKPHTIRTRNGDPFDLRWENLYIIPDGHHQCSDCGGILPASEFQRVEGKKPRVAGHCHECKDYRARSQDYAHKTKVKRYGITTDDYTRMFGEQDGGCAICKRPPMDKRLAIDHCHTTGKVRGLLCGPCNVSLGAFKDDPRVLLEAAKYLLKHRS